MIEHDSLRLAWIGAGAAIIGGVVSGAYQHLRDWCTRPRLKLKFNPDVDKIEAAWGSGGAHHFDGVLVRASVTNEGVTAAQNCRIFLTSLTTEHASGSTRTPLTGSRQLPWAGWTFEPRSLQKGITFYIDLARVSKASSGWQFTFQERRASDEGLEEYTGTYRFHIVAVADNAAPTYLQVDIDYNGNWHNLRVWVPSK